MPPSPSFSWDGLGQRVGLHQRFSASPGDWLVAPGTRPGGWALARRQCRRCNLVRSCRSVRDGRSHLVQRLCFFSISR